MRRLWPCACLALLLAACATFRPPPELITASAQEALLRSMSGFSLDGRAVARDGEKGSPAISLSWIEHAGESRVRFSGPLGIGGLKLAFGPGLLEVTDSDGQSFRDQEAEQVLAAQLGFVPPFQALRYWVLGLPAPGEPPVDRHSDATGRVADMTQLGWHIKYESRRQLVTHAGAVQLPQRLVATMGNLRLLLVVDRWKLQGAD